MKPWILIAIIMLFIASFAEAGEAVKPGLFDFRRTETSGRQLPMFERNVSRPCKIQPWCFQTLEKYA